MTDVVDETEDGRMRAVVEQDMYPEAPDHDGQGYVLSVDYSRTMPSVEMLHAPIGDPFAEDVRQGVRDALMRFGVDWHGGKVDRYMRQAYDVVSIDVYDRRDGGQIVELVTDQMCDGWGIPAGAPRRESANLADWRAWDEGDVWTVELQELVTWERRHGNGAVFDTREEWETFDTCGGFYGYDYAVESAREQLSYHAPKVAR